VISPEGVGSTEKGKTTVAEEEKKEFHPKTDAVRGEGGDQTHHAYHTTMWAVSCLLFLLFVITLTALFLMWRYYRCGRPTGRSNVYI